MWWDFAVVIEHCRAAIQTREAFGCACSENQAFAGGLWGEYRSSWRIAGECPDIALRTP
jgi:hypothetical protein